jgi:hypothetical protein
MELDDLKDIWKKNPPEFKVKNEVELALMLKGSSKSIVDKLKRSVWFELIFTIIAGIVFLGYALTLESGSFKWTSISMTALFVVYSFYYVKKLSILNRFNPGEGNLKTNIDNLITSLTSYLKFYKRSYTILYPAYFVLGLIFGAIERGADQFINSLSKPSVIISLVSLAIFFFFSSTFLTTWWLKKLYGNHLEKLKNLAHELEG